MNIGLWPAIAMALALASPGVLAQQKPLPQGDARIVAAREALRTGDRQLLERLAAAPEAHVLDPYVPYWLLTNKLARTDPVPVGELQAFLRSHAGSTAAERLRAAWLKRLAKDGDWSGFVREYAALDNPDAEMRCIAWQARLASGDGSVRQEVLAQWPALTDAHEACNPVLQATVASGTVGADDLWWRFRRQIDSRNPTTALATLAWLGPLDKADKAAYERAIKAPVTVLDQLPPNFAVQRTSRELALAALVRLARQDAAAAYVRFVRINDRLSFEDRSYVHAVLGHHGAQSRLPQALDWFRAAGETPTTSAQRTWRVRAALRAEDWSQVATSIGMLTDAEREQPEWIYWLGRALQAQQQQDQADALFGRLAGNVDFYGLLAAEELGHNFAPPAAATPLSAADQARAANDPALQRALAFYRLDLRTEAVREWAQAVRGRDSAFLAAAAQLALDRGLYDRAINTAEMAGSRDHFELRFVTPYRQLIEPQVHRQRLDLAWVYGLMRQESRFVVPARSSAGAQGLMQVMPATGKWVAGKIGLNGYKQQMLNDPDTNVLLGTSYMRLILDDLDNHPVLASAGYNAGPGRARRWRDDRPLEASIYVETIPFDETRDYVKKVLANAVVYAAMLDGRPQSLKSRLGVIAPRATGDDRATD